METGSWKIHIQISSMEIWEDKIELCDYNSFWTSRVVTLMQFVNYMAKGTSQNCPLLLFSLRKLQVSFFLVCILNFLSCFPNLWSVINEDYGLLLPIKTIHHYWKCKTVSTLKWPVMVQRATREAWMPHGKGQMITIKTSRTPLLASPSASNVINKYVRSLHSEIIQVSKTLFLYFLVEFYPDQSQFWRMGLLWNTS